MEKKSQNQETDSKEKRESLDFIRARIAEDVKNNKNEGKVITRFPPEPNGYLHIGHAKSICLNFGLAQEGEKRACHLRFDDTNPCKEEDEFVEAIKEDVRWLGFDWGENLFFASDRFDTLYEYAIHLIKKGRAYVDSLSPEEIREYRGTLTSPGKESPYRKRSVEENLELFEKMRRGDYQEGACVLRAKIDMASPNMNMRDPTLYRIRHETHHRTKDKWCIYPMYDFAHGQCDALEGITHSLCTLEFVDHRPLYNWFLEHLPVPAAPQQIEFARLNLNYTIMSKRKLHRLVDEAFVSGWDDPRMPTISGLRRRGYTPEAIREFCKRIGLARIKNVVDIALLEHCLREELNKKAQRVMGVLKPVKVVIENYPEMQTEELEAVNNPEDPKAGMRKVPFSREIFIEQDDFMEKPAKKFYRLAPGREVRLRYAYFIKCKHVIKDEKGNIQEIRCTYDPETKGGSAPDGRKVKPTLHWVSAKHAVESEVRLYDHLFTEPNPDEQEKRDFTHYLNPASKEILTSCRLEPFLKNANPGNIFQFERLGYFCVDSRDSSPGSLVFNRTVSLRDSWAKVRNQQKKQP